MNETLKLLVLFSGSRSVEKEAEKLGFETFSIDWKNFEGTDLVCDIEFLSIEELLKVLPWTPDVIWASVPCTTYSIAAISHHRDNGKPKTPFARKSDNLVKNTLSIISHFDCKFFIENPTGYLRKMPFMRGLPMVKITYCSYGFKNMKPTDIWSNWIKGDTFWKQGEWIPRKACKNYKYDKEGNVINKHCYHEEARRSSRTGTQGLKNNYERSKIPPDLCREILESCLNLVVTGKD